MSVWLEKPRRRPDGRHKAFGRTTVGLSKISLKFFLDLSRIRTVLPYRPVCHTFAARNFHIKASRIRTIGMVVRTIDLMHAISIYVAHTSRP
jgi:hypothetical protein